MRTALIASLLITAIATPAFAEEDQAQAVPSPGADDLRVAIPAPKSDAQKGCTGTAMLSLQGNYPLQDFGLDASGGHPVSQNIIAVTCPIGSTSWTWTGDIWNSVQLSGDGTYGHRGPGDEWDGESLFQGPCGPLKCSAYIAVFALDLGRGLKSKEDDFVQAYGEVAAPLPLSKTWEMEPFVRLTRNEALGGSALSLSSLRVGSRFNGPMTLPIFGAVTASFEGAKARNFDPEKPGAFPYKTVWRGEATLTKQNVWQGWSLTGGAKVTEHVGITPVVKLVRNW